MKKREKGALTVRLPGRRSPHPPLRGPPSPTGEGFYNRVKFDARRQVEETGGETPPLQRKAIRPFDCRADVRLIRHGTAVPPSPNGEGFCRGRRPRRPVNMVILVKTVCLRGRRSPHPPQAVPLPQRGKVYGGRFTGEGIISFYSYRRRGRRNSRRSICLFCGSLRL